MSYDDDYRVTSANNKWYDEGSFNEENMEALVTFYDYDTDEEVVLKVPCVYEACHVCKGKGKHVNPSIDSHGLTSRDLAEDPDFRDSYFRGAFDVTCYTCEGKRVTPEPHWEMLEEDIKKKLYKKREDEAFYARERAAEMRYGY
ncbi:hypothetical protein GF420_15695 [candidate division GN15 bacterium]|nr:hypothetical protein [candidate division GN15 bacterium]